MVRDHLLPRGGPVRSASSFARLGAFVAVGQQRLGLVTGMLNTSRLHPTGTASNPDALQGMRPNSVGKPDARPESLADSLDALHKGRTSSLNRPVGLRVFAGCFALTFLLLKLVWELLCDPVGEGIGKHVDVLYHWIPYIRLTGPISLRCCVDGRHMMPRMRN